MAFDISQSQVDFWLDTLPFDTTAFPSPDSCERHLKRRRSSKHSESRKRHGPISPPRSGAGYSSPSPEPGAMLPSTPNKPLVKRPADDANVDNDQTPRATTISGRGPIINAPDFKARSQSRSQSDTCSHDSKRSKRSQSPTKNFPLYGPEGRRLVRASLGFTNAHTLPQALRQLIGEMRCVSAKNRIMPQRFKTELEKLPEVECFMEPLFDYMFYDDEMGAESEGLVKRAGAEELVRRASRIAERSGDCASMLSDEAAWNGLVHTPLLEMLVSDMRDAPEHKILDFMPCTTTNIDLSYHRFAESASRVDYVFRFHPKRDSTILTENASLPSRQEPQQIQPDTAPCFNWTSDRMLQQYSLGVSIETKRHGGDIAKGEQQLAIWHAAQWEFLLSRAGPSAVDELGFLPGIVVQGHSWSLVITTWNQAITTVLPSVEFGSTDSTVGVLQVIAGLRKLRAWSMDTLWPWYKRNLPELRNSTADN
ncbi:hypothetical protein FOCG_17639 [Fusarium oxysporum f. sp. radicis-lycopersici 26381]|nr:hypothetical protein FOCG_17639 [Fusarium oxysporum f. sp. radicis-lycopersici 26381]WKT54037.1 hypothetical protein QSH57_004621 [Fusarium oxysporum f. sp. vasinfectum]